MEASLRILMNGLIDYAGLFPPASLDMPTAVVNYAGYRKGGQSEWLGRFVLPVSRLREFSTSLAGLEIPGTPRRRTGASAEEPFRLSVLIGDDPARDFETISDFSASDDHPAAIIDSLEMKATGISEIAHAIAQIPAGITPYFEVPIQDEPAPLLSAIGKAGARAKMRTGGVTPSQVPSSAAVARFIAACAKAGVPFKATAGLHHPFRSVRKLTYEPDGPESPMHGFLNVFLAAAFAKAGMDAETLTALLQEESPRSITFRGDEAAWRGHRVEASRLRETRRDFAIAFGSCSFEEPRQDLEKAGLL
jgi:hypothetical protein